MQYTSNNWRKKIAEYNTGPVSFNYIIYSRDLHHEYSRGHYYDKMKYLWRVNIPLLHSLFEMTNQECINCTSRLITILCQYGKSKDHTGRYVPLSTTSCQ